jgi:uncharacterized protein YcbX
MATLHALVIYPVKSLRGIPLDRASMEDGGLRGDRRFMLVDDTGRLITQREFPRLALVGLKRESDGLVLDAPGLETLHLLPPDETAPRIAASVWSDTVESRLCAPEVQAWFSRYLGVSCRLVFLPSAAGRPFPEAGPGGTVDTWADAAPLTVLSTASVQALAEEVGRPLEMERFRPNLVIDGVPAYAEDRWARVRIGAVEIQVVQPCARCVLTTIDPARGEKSADQEPLRTLARTRRGPRGAELAQHAVALGDGELVVGAPVEVIAEK